MIKQVWEITKRIWQIRGVQIAIGIILLLIGLALSPIPGPGGFIFWLPALFILFGKRRVMRFLLPIRGFIYRHIGHKIRIPRINIITILKKIF